jgi:hypothetical protein
MIKDFDFDKFWIGTLAGLVAPLFSFSMYYLINYRGMPWWRFIAHLRLADTYTSIVTLCLLSNLAMFYLFIWRKKYQGARGVLGVTFIWAGFIMYLKFFTQE